MARDPFAFLDSGSKDRTLLLLLLALIKRSDGVVELDLTELTAISDGDSFIKHPSDNGSKLVLRYARRGAEAYFLSPEDQPSTPRPTSRVPVRTPPQPVTDPEQPRHAVHDDLDLALREEEMTQRAAASQRERLNRAKAEAGTMPWRTVPPTRQ